MAPDAARFTNQSWRYVNFVADASLQALACDEDGATTGASVYLAFFSVLGLITFLGCLYLLYRIKESEHAVVHPEDDAPIFTPWTAGMLLIPLLFISLGIEIGGFGVDCRLGCGSYAAYGSNISYIAGNLSTHVYVCIFIVLVIMPFSFLMQTNIIREQRLNAASKEGSFADPKYFARAKFSDALLILGFVTMAVTGMVPTEALVCDPWLMSSGKCFGSGGYFAQTVMHGIGINVGIFLFLINGTRRLFLAMSQHPEYETWAKARSNIDAQKALLWIGMAAGYSAAFHFVFWLLITNFAGAVKVEHNMPVSQLCMLYRTRDECVGGHLTLEQQRLLGDKYRCRWNEKANFGIPACILDKCDVDGILDKNRVGISGEYLGFMFFSLGAGILLIWIQQAEQEAFKINSAWEKQKRRVSTPSSSK